MKKYANFDELLKSGDCDVEIGSDLHKFTDLYKSFGVECRIGVLEGDDAMLEEGKSGQFIITLSESNWCGQECETLSDKFEGHLGFYTSILFDKHGKFIQQGFWE